MVTPSFTVALSSGVISLSQLYSTSRCWTMPFNSWGERTPRDAKDQAELHKSWSGEGLECSLWV